MPEQPEQWVTMKEAAKQLNTSPSKISRLAAIGAIETRDSVTDRRIKLVNLPEVKKLLETQGMQS